MSSVFFIRHQAAGLVSDFPFAKEPTPEQVASVVERVARSHGAAHPKTHEPYWVKVVEVNVLEPGELAPAPPAPSAGSVNIAALGGVAVSGTGTVST